MNLTKAGEKYAKCELDELVKLINDKDTINFNEWLGASVNPNLSSELIREMYKKMKLQNELEIKDKSIPAATKTRNSTNRGNIRKNLGIHKNLSDESIKALIINNKITEPIVFKNDNITSEHLQLYFDIKVLLNDGSYSFIAFGYLMKAKNLTQDLVLKWYHILLKYADWTYNDNQWYAVISALLGWDDCPEEILNTIASTPSDNKDKWNSKTERFRQYALEHKNTTDTTRFEVYQITGDIELLPKQAKDIFLF